MVLGWAVSTLSFTLLMGWVRFHVFGMRIRLLTPAVLVAFYFGTTLILDGKATVGVVVNVFMSILTGSYALVLLGPEQQAIAQAQGAAAKLYATIDRVPTIDSLSDEGLRLDEPSSEGAHVKKETKKGQVKLENVVFRYPSRPDVPILKGTLALCSYHLLQFLIVYRT
jgi:ATP-binding cassette subfamily B (MDR/TAP) protein 1